MNRLISVLHVAQPTEGGVARCVGDLVRDQVERGWEVAVACPADGDLAETARSEGARHLLWTAGRAPGAAIASEAARLGRALTISDPMVVHLHSSKAGLAGRLALRGRRPTVFQPHAWSFEAVDGVLEVAARLWERHAAAWSDVIICVSEGERRHGELAGIDAQWRVVPNGVDLRRFSRATANRQTHARTTLGLDGSPLVVCVGRLSRQKGQDLLLQAWPAVLSSVPEARLVLVGEGPTRHRLEARPPPRVEFVGGSNDVANWFSAADLVVAPSRWEGMSLVVLEAMATGRPVVATNVPGASELIGSDAGAVVPIDARALVAPIVERLLDPNRRANEGAEGRLRVERFHDSRTTVAAVAEIYLEVLARRGSTVRRTPSVGYLDPESGANERNPSE